MARRTVTYNGTSLQDTTYQTQDFIHESLDGRELNIQRLADREGGKLVSDMTAPKIITLRGVVKGTSIDNLESNLDSLKQLLALKEKNLDIEYSSGTRRYIASVRKVTIERAHYHITFAPFEVEFVVSNPPFGKTVDTSTFETTQNFTSTGTYSGNYSFTGSAPPMPIIKMEVNSAANFNSVTFTNDETGHAISVNRTFTVGEILTIDTDAYSVDVDGTAVDFTGQFPEFIADGNAFKIAIRANTCNITIKMIYYPLYY